MKKKPILHKCEESATYTVYTQIKNSFKTFTIKGIIHLQYKEDDFFV